jgi:hypothetical protein
MKFVYEGTLQTPTLPQTQTVSNQSVVNPMWTEAWLKHLEQMPHHYANKNGFKQSQIDECRSTSSSSWLTIPSLQGQQATMSMRWSAHYPHS